MLEEKQYAIKELNHIIGGGKKDNIAKKLTRYDIDFTTEGRGKNLTFTLLKIKDPFKVFCITELGFRAQSNFNHLRHFLYHFFCDDYFMSMPDEVKEHMMNGFGYHISRQTIANYERQLREKNYISMDGEYFYYFAFHKKQTITTKEKYLEAWHNYWQWKDLGADALDAMGNIILEYGGVPRKQHKTEKNAFYLKKIDYLVNLISESIEKELK